MKNVILRAAAFLRAKYLVVDARSLGLFRIIFGLHLIVNLHDRTRGPDGVAFYTNDGMLPNHYALFAPMGDKMWSLLFPFSTPSEVQVALLIILAVYVLYVVGFLTKLFQVLVVVCLISLDNRNLVLQNGGIVVTNLVAVWSVFLPLGARFSVDHLRRSLREHRESSPAELADRRAMVRAAPDYARLAFLGLLVNFACIYFFNYAHKTGATWRGGSAVHWVLWQNRIATIWAAWLRMHEPVWLSPVATYATLGIEAAMPVFLLSPIAQRWTRRVAIACIFLLHGGIALMMTLGPFSYSIMAFSLLLLGRHDWDRAAKLWRRARPDLTVLYDPSSGWHHELCRWLARLDTRSRLAFADIRDAPATGAGADHDRRVGLAPAAPDCLFAVYGNNRPEVDTGSWALARAVSALPLGALFGWMLRFGFARRLLERRIERCDADPPDMTPFVEPPALAFMRGLRVALGQLFAGVLFATIVLQLGSDNWIVPEKYRVKNRPEFMRQIIEYLRLPQGWSMFSPDAPRDDGTIVIDAVLSDGRHIDPRKQRPPDFDAAFHGPWFDDQQWCDWDLRMRWDSSRHFYPYFRDYIARLDQMTSWEQDATIRYFDVYWVNNAAPPPGSTRPFDLKRQLLFSGGIRP